MASVFTDKALAIACDVERVIRAMRVVHREQRLGAISLERVRVARDGHGHQAFVGRRVVEFRAVLAPPRLRTAVGGDAPRLSRSRERGRMHFGLPVTFRRAVGHPAAVGWHAAQFSDAALRCRDTDGDRR